MAITDSDNLIGRLEITERPGTLSWGTPLDFLKKLVRIVKVTFPVNPGNNFVTSGFQSPSPDDTDKMWAQSDRNRNPIGWFAYIKGQWRRFYTKAPGEIGRIIGNSDSPPDGWEPLISGDVTGLDSDVLSQLLGESVETSPGSGVYKLYWARFVGYSEG